MCTTIERKLWLVNQPFTVRGRILALYWAVRSPDGLTFAMYYSISYLLDCTLDRNFLSPSAFNPSWICFFNRKLRIALLQLLWITNSYVPQMMLFCWGIDGYAARALNQESRLGYYLEAQPAQNAMFDVPPHSYLIRMITWFTVYSQWLEVCCLFYFLTTDPQRLVTSSCNTCNFRVRASIENIRTWSLIEYHPAYVFTMLLCQCWRAIHVSQGLQHRWWHLYSEPSLSW